MKILFWYALTFVFLLSACSSPSPTPATDVQAPEPLVQETEEFALISWQNLNLSQELGVEIQNMTALLYTQEGAILGSFYDEKDVSYIARSEDLGETWSKVTLDKGITYPRTLFSSSDGTLYLGGGVDQKTSPFWSSSDDGKTWIELGNGVLPNRQAQAVWDILELPTGNLLLATDSLSNDPTQENPALYEWDGATLREFAKLPGLGVLSLAIDAEGTLYAATEESAEHDDPNLAGQAHVFRSTDGGETWEDTGLLEGANRVYTLLVLSDGNTLMAGTGIRGELYRSTDQGDTWIRLEHTPEGVKNAQADKPEMKDTVSRIYSLLETAEGMILAGTGNKTGDVFQLNPEEEWTLTTKDHQSNVVWGLLQTPDGTLWAGTGSYGGDILMFKP